MPVGILGSSKGQRSRRVETEAGRPSLVVFILRGPPADTQLRLISRWSTIRLPVVVATVSIIVATETAEFARVGAAGGPGGGEEEALVERRGLRHLRDHSREGMSRGGHWHEVGGGCRGADSEQGFHARHQARKGPKLSLSSHLDVAPRPLLLTLHLPAITNFLLALRHSTFSLAMTVHYFYSLSFPCLAI